jgi:hypothetical protein
LLSTVTPPAALDPPTFFEPPEAPAPPDELESPELVEPAEALTCPVPEAPPEPSVLPVLSELQASRPKVNRTNWNKIDVRSMDDPF